MIEKLDRFKQLSRQSGASMTIQKKMVLEALAKRHDHPTAEEIFEDVHRRLPGVSRATIYRILNTLVEMDIARKVFHPGDYARFETRMVRHHHLVCRHCGKMSDLDDSVIKPIRPPRSGTTDFNIDDYSVNFFGLCSKCNSGKKNKRRIIL